ncbi:MULTISPECIES: DUF4411 family protein [Parafrankia]|uniref:DUF4411 family protein n=1 Tax=Parafrankia TaxID=2994362 RepID=UPI000B83A624|nr:MULTISPECIES: DUF4411 family protein [Parafrankia]MBE3203550.1 DUF4411 family protein [Parafrankia sp. CH37]
MYLVDSNVLIQAKNRHYPFDVVPGFWDWLTNGHLAGKVYVVEKVADEIMSGNDELAAWLKGQPNSFRLPSTPDDAPSLARVALWANGAGYAARAVNEFFSAADFHLVAQALTQRFVVVTHEVPNTGSVKRIKIPDACHAVGVACIDPFRMLRSESAKFVLL